MGGAQARAAVPATPSSCRRACRPTPRPARPSSRCSTTRRRSSRGSRSTRRSSTSAGCARIAGTPVEIARAAAPRRARAGRPADHRRRRPDQVPGQGRQRRRQARRPAGRRRPTASSPSCIRCRSSGCGASGEKTAAQAARPRHHDRRRGGALDEATLVAILGRGSGRHLHALAHNRDPRPRARRSGAAARSARSGHSAAAPRSVAELDAALVGLVDRVTRRLRRARRVAAPSSCACASPISRAPRARTRCPRRPPTPTRSCRRAHLLRGARRSSAPGPHADRHRRRPTSRRGAVQLALPLDGPDRPAIDAVVDGIRARFGTEAITRGVLVGRDPGLTMPVLPDPPPDAGRLGTR